MQVQLHMRRTIPTPVNDICTPKRFTIRAKPNGMYHGNVISYRLAIEVVTIVLQVSSCSVEICQTSILNEVL